MLAGVAVFMLGMNFLENALKLFSGRRFKLFLKKHTAHKLSAVAGGALITAILQSSSVVNLVVLGFVGAGIINITNALAIMLGTNLGTTLSTWVVATLGFKLSIEAYTMPVIGIAGITMMLFKENSRWYQWSIFFLGLGFLFMGLDYMKEAATSAVAAFDLAYLKNYPVFFYLLAGIVITSLIQSSSATVAIVLSALYAQIIDLYAATAIVLGSELGTTVKLLIAAANGSSIKKRVAAGNFLFNTISIVIIFLILSPVNRLITGIIGIKDNLVALAFFQTFINLVSIALFYPLLDRLSGFLSRRFRNDDNLTAYIHKVAVSDVELSILALEKEAARFIHLVILYCRHIFNHAHEAPDEQDNKKFVEQTIPEQYDYIKHLQGEIYNYYISIQAASLTNEESQRINALISSVRNSMYAAKSVKDAIPDIEQFRNSSVDIKHDIYKKSKALAIGFCTKLTGIINSGKLVHFEELVSLRKTIEEQYDEALKALYKDKQLAQLLEVEVSTILNFNRELYTFFKSMTFSVKDLLLKEKEASYFDDLPGFIN